jgi:hypothetical protein
MSKNLRAIEVFHYVYGALTCFCGLFVLLVVALGGLLSSDWMMENASEAPPPWLGSLLSGIGMGVFLFVEAVGVLNIYSGRCIARRKHRTLSMVVAAFDCLSIPLGLILGIFTLVALSDDEVRREYEVGAPVPAPMTGPV